jgi:hypothetical protein
MKHDNCTFNLHYKTIEWQRSVVVLIGLLLTCIFWPTHSFSQESEPEYDEISVFLSVPRIGGTEVSALLKGETIYISITDLFSFLKINNSSTASFDKVSGFFLNQADAYEIDRVNNKILYKKKTYQLNPGDLMRTETNLYLKINYFGEIFGLECTFNFRSLTVTLNTRIDLPVIREMRQEQLRKSIGQLKGEVEVDTTLKQSFTLFNFGNLDWTATSSQSPNEAVNYRFTSSIGAIVAGGEASLQINYFNNSPFILKDQYYQWRYANNDLKLFKQATLGKIYTNSLSTLTSSVVGGQITNTPTTYRRSFGTYTLSDVTEPGWMVELYVNNVLVDYKRADASGFFTFEIPLIYGTTNVKLQFYGPWGEEKSKEKLIEIPFNFLPTGRFEYSISGGMVDDSLNRAYSRANFDYGVSRFLTIGAGVEYLTPLDSEARYIPFAKASLKIGSKLLLSGEYNYGVNFNTILNWKFKNDIQFELNYKKYDKGQRAINTSYLEERKFTASLPLRFKNFSLYTRLGLNQYLLQTSTYTTAELLFSGTLFGINTNLTTNALYNDGEDPTVFSSLAMSLRLPGSFILTPQAQYNYNLGKFTTARIGLEKKIFKKGYFNFAYERNISEKYNNFELGVRYDFSFAQAGVIAQRTGDKTTFTESANGSIFIDSKTKYIGASGKSTSGTGGLVIYPFMDINCNDKRDEGEPKALGLQVHINGGRMEKNDKDTTIRIFELEPYADHIVTLDGSAFDNIAWQMKITSLKVTVTPNMFRKIEVPVYVLGEVSGYVYMQSGNRKNGQGRIIINIYNEDRALVKSTLSESDGYFSYLGLKPGNYIAGIDTSQMAKLAMVASPEIKFSIKPNIDGDVIDNFQFTVKKIKEEVIEENEPVKEPAKDNVTVKKSTATIPASEQIQKPDTSIVYMVQLAALRKKVDINSVFGMLLKVMPQLTIEESLEKDGLYHYRTGKFSTPREARALAKKIVSNGWKECFIVSRTITQTTKQNTQSVENNCAFKIQLLVSVKARNIEATFNELIEKIEGLKIVEITDEKGLYHYMTGCFGTKTEAAKFVKVLNENGWKDCYIVNVKNTTE